MSSLFFAVLATATRLVASSGTTGEQIHRCGVSSTSHLRDAAVHFDRLLASGAVGSLAELARSMQVTRARMTQINALNHLAPDLQERLLFLPRTVSGRAGNTERDLRAVAAEVGWGRQRRAIERGLR